MLSNRYHSLGLVGHDEVFVRVGYLVHAARGQNIKEWINGISQRLGPPIPLYERPKALIYQAKEPPVAAATAVAAAAARNASCENGSANFH